MKVDERRRVVKLLNDGHTYMGKSEILENEFYENVSPFQSKHIKLTGHKAFVANNPIECIFLPYPYAQWHMTNVSNKCSTTDQHATPIVQNPFLCVSGEEYGNGTNLHHLSFNALHS